MPSNGATPTGIIVTLSPAPAEYTVPSIPSVVEKTGAILLIPEPMNRVNLNPIKGKSVRNGQNR